MLKPLNHDSPGPDRRAPSGGLRTRVGIGSLATQYGEGPDRTRLPLEHLPAVPLHPLPIREDDVRRNPGPQGRRQAEQRHSRAREPHVDAKELY
eukprot:212393-Heterocapsa_arctica.AAC.1